MESYCAAGTMIATEGIIAAAVAAEAGAVIVMSDQDITMIVTATGSERGIGVVADVEVQLVVWVAVEVEVGIVM